MTERMDAVMLRKYTDKQTGETKSSSTKIGVAWPLDGGGFRLELEAVPVPTIWEGKAQCTIMLFPPRPRQDSSPSPQRAQASSAPAFDSGDITNDIAF